jgi:hypothetical protein
MNYDTCIWYVVKSDRAYCAHVKRRFHWWSFCGRLFNYFRKYLKNTWFCQIFFVLSPQSLSDVSNVLKTRFSTVSPPRLWKSNVLFDTYWTINAYFNETSYLSISLIQFPVFFNELHNSIKHNGYGDEQCGTYKAVNWYLPKTRLMFSLQI